MTNRRSFLKSSALAWAALGARAQTASRTLFTVVETGSGKVEGVVTSGIHEFKGIPYGASTAAANRFMPPRKPSPWTNVRECLGYGHICPQVPADLRSDYGMLIQWDLQSGGMSENCLNLNLWTPGVKDGAKRPVLVSFHGGGYASGSGNAPGYDGAQLARFGDVVVVTVNHRLASFGYVNLVDAGAPPEFAQAGVTGLMDLVASLEWVRDNIGQFGGDPAKVMIFGQSGGGAKTSCVLALPSAKGLFHCAAVQSGSALRAATREQSAKSAEALLAKLEISKANIAEIQKIPWQRILDAQASLGASVGFSPVVDGTVLPHHPFDPVAPPESAEVPVIVSTTLEDAALALTNFGLDEAGLKAMLNQRFSPNADEIYTVYHKLAPKKSSYLIQAQVLTDSGGRRNAITQAERKAALGKAPVYMYLWSYESPAFGGKFGAVHGTDVSASFDNYRDGIGGTGSPQQRALWERFAASWVAFARTGDPNNPKIPAWPGYEPTKRATMVFDTEVRVENDPRSEIRKLWDRTPARPPQRG